MMKLRYLPILLLYLIPTFSVAGPIDKIAELIKQGKAHELAAYFASTIDVTILENSNAYSKTQAEIILEKFFKENKPLSVKLIHRIGSNPNYKFGVLVLTTDKGKYRVAFTLKDPDKAMTMIELRIESEKT
jgi:hypothetical protein